LKIKEKYETHEHNMNKISSKNEHNRTKLTKPNPATNHV